MKAKGISKLCVRLSVLAVSTGTAGGIAVSCGGEVPMDCTTGRGAFNVQYIGAENCGLGNGDIVGAQTYQGQGSEKVGGQPLPDLTLASAAIQVNRLGVARDAAEAAGAAITGTPYAHAKWDKPRPDGNNFCTIAAATAKIQNAAVPADEATENPGVAAQDMTYEWTNIRFYNTPGIQGLQFTADLKYTDALYQPDPATPPASCTTTVKAVGVFPAAGSCVHATTVHGVAMEGQTAAEATDFVVDSAIDSAFCGDLKQSGISSDFSVTCVPATAPEWTAPKSTCTATEDDPATDAWEGPVCTPSATERVATQGFCFLTSDQIPVLK